MRLGFFFALIIFVCFWVLYTLDASSKLHRSGLGMQTPTGIINDYQD